MINSNYIKLWHREGDGQTTNALLGWSSWPCGVCKRGPRAVADANRSVCRMTCCVHHALPLVLHCMLSVVTGIDSGGPMIQGLGTRWQLEWQSLCWPEVHILAGG